MTYPVEETAGRNARPGDLVLLGPEVSNEVPLGRKQRQQLEHHVVLAAGRVFRREEARHAGDNGGVDELLLVAEPGGADDGYDGFLALECSDELGVGEVGLDDVYAGWERGVAAGAGKRRDSEALCVDEAREQDFANVAAPLGC